MAAVESAITENYIGRSQVSRDKSAKALDREGVKLGMEIPKAYQHSKKTFTGMNAGAQAFVQSLITKTNNAPAWVKPACMALAVAGISAVVVWIRPGLFSFQMPMPAPTQTVMPATPKPTPAPTQTVTPATPKPAPAPTQTVTPATPKPTPAPTQTVMPATPNAALALPPNQASVSLDDVNCTESSIVERTKDVVINHYGTIALITVIAVAALGIAVYVYRPQIFGFGDNALLNRGAGVGAGDNALLNRGAGVGAGDNALPLPNANLGASCGALPLHLLAPNPEIRRRPSEDNLLVQRRLSEGNPAAAADESEVSVHEDEVSVDSEGNRVASGDENANLEADGGVDANSFFDRVMQQRWSEGDLLVRERLSEDNLVASDENANSEAGAVDDGANPFLAGRKVKRRWSESDLLSAIDSAGDADSASVADDNANSDSEADGGVDANSFFDRVMQQPWYREIQQRWSEGDLLVRERLSEDNLVASDENANSEAGAVDDGANPFLAGRKIKRRWSESDLLSAIDSAGDADSASVADDNANSDSEAYGAVDDGMV